MEREREFTYWQPRVMQHTSPLGTTEYAIHEVYFNHEHRAYTWTVDALSPRFPSPDALRSWISEKKLTAPNHGVACGDLGYSYYRGDFEMWLTHIDEPALDYSDE